MERTVYQDYRLELSLETLTNVELYLKKEELAELAIKTNQLFGLFCFNDIKDRALAEKFFKMGYLAAHVIPGKHSDF